MRARPVLFFLFGLVVCSRGFSASVEAPISKVTVYPDRAVVERSVEVTLPAGVSEVRILRLTPDLLDESLQVSARSANDLAILNVRSAFRFTDGDVQGRLQALLDRRSGLEEEIAQAEIRLNLLERQADYLNRASAASTAPGNEGELRDVAYWSEFLVYLDDAFTELLPKIHAAKKARMELQERLDLLNREIAQFQDEERKRFKEAIVQVESGAPSTAAVFSVSYVVMNAGWSPVYNVRVSSAEKEIRLDYQATIRQRTGEPWENVDLVLSTARPALGGNPPDLYPWIVDVFDPRPMPRSASDRSRPEAMQVRALKADGESPSFVTSEAIVEAGLTAVHLVIPTPATVPADNQPYRIGITAVDLEGDFFHTAVPKLSPHAYLQTRVTHTGEAPILPGGTSVFVDGNLVGHSRLPHVEPNETFELPLGVDEAILVERKLVRRFEEERGLLSKTVHTRFEYATTLTNRRGTPETLVLKDQVPVSRDERVEVKVTEASGGVPDEEEADAGVYVWKRTLDPGEKIVIPFGFAVEHPKDVTVTGL